ASLRCAGGGARRAGVGGVGRGPPPSTRGVSRLRVTISRPAHRGSPLFVFTIAMGAALSL
ncbi:MAG: hypothetical protein K2M85_06295, partial [Paramuribaculum sp.]|nr:hypothetical protein [Paramuribaculum sp.]